MKFKPQIEALHQSGIRRASQRCQELGGINLGQGICDIPVDPQIIESAHQAMLSGHNLYGAKEGLFALREKLAQKISHFNKIKVDVDHVMVSHGSTGSFISATEVLFEQGDEVILFEPFYGYHKKLLELKGVVCQSVPMDLFDLSIDFDRLEKSITSKTRGLVVCTPCNPTGKVWSRDELLQVGRLAKKHKLWILTDEIYEHIVYPGYEHISLASLEDFFEHTITISGFSKSYNLTGWRLGYASGPKDVIEKMALVQDLIYICPSTPLQHAALKALELPQSYYDNMQNLYLQKRDYMIQALTALGFKVPVIQGAYYLMVNFENLSFKNDQEAMDYLLEKARVASVTGTSFFADVNRGQMWLRFCFGLSIERLKQAISQLEASLLK